MKSNSTTIGKKFFYYFANWRSNPFGQPDTDYLQIELLISLDFDYLE